jgi:dTDP-4-dehydrorhamnose 3,5-epimerase
VKFKQTRLPEVIRIEPEVHRDERGCFLEVWHSRRFAENGIDARFVQENSSASSRGTLRGIHYQVGKPQGKLVRVVDGAVFDVAVDLRRSSRGFGRWTGAVLSAENRHQLWIPAGFGHAFLVLSESAGFEYSCTDYYAPDLERQIRWDDPDIGIEWPLEDGVAPVMSQKDASAPGLKAAETYP